MPTVRLSSATTSPLLRASTGRSQYSDITRSRSTIAAGRAGPGEMEHKA
jgi:hypothetical protein